MERDALSDLDGRSAEFIRRQVEGGLYASAGDVVRAALRLLEDETKLDDLRSALIEGERSGPSVAFDFEAFIARKRGVSA